MDIEDIYREIVARAIFEFEANRGFSTDAPTDIALDSDSTPENMAWIELHEDVLDKAYGMSKEYKEYE